MTTDVDEDDLPAGSCLGEFVLILALSILALIIGVAWVVAEGNGSPVR